MPGLIVLLLFLLFLFYIVSFYFTLIKERLNDFRGLIRYGFTKNYFDLYNVSGSYRRSSDETDGILHKKFRYYQNLSTDAKIKFQARLFSLLNKIEIVGHAGLEVTQEMKMCVLFSKVQLTFGLKNYRFTRFNRFILYPQTFYSRYFETDLKGLTSGKGFIIFSWQDFEEGYFVHDDNYNLGLHEMAHALRLELKSRGEWEWTEANRLCMLLDEESSDERLLASRGTPSILREYAQTNNEEYFSVCVEYFFEVPALLKEHKPDTYHLLRRLLNQDPLNANQDYKVEMMSV